MYYYRCTLRSLQRLLVSLCSNSLSLILPLMCRSAHQLKHVSRPEVHIAVRTKMRLDCGERHTHLSYTSVYTRARAIHSNDSVSFYTDTASCHFVYNKLTFILLESKRIESQPASRHLRLESTSWVDNPARSVSRSCFWGLKLLVSAS